LLIFRLGGVDKYGRNVSATQERDDLRRFYRLDHEDEEEATVEKPTIDYARGAVLLESSDEEELEVEDGSDDDGVVTLGLDHSRPIPIPRTDDDIDLNEDELADLDAQAAAAKAEAENAPSVDPTSRLAVVNLDWDHVKASHLYKIFSSLFAPMLRGQKGVMTVRGKVTRVRVYPSEFGKTRLAREEKEGPPAEVFKTRREATNEDEVNKQTVYSLGGEEEVDGDALRKYQLERLRYVQPRVFEAVPDMRI
jgi:hypothetical protein